MTKRRGVVEIPVGEYVALVDEADAALVGVYRWRPLQVKSGTIYAQTRGPANAWLYMHRLILEVADGFDVDHKNRNGLDNRRANLRTATRSQNIANGVKRAWRDGRPTSSIFKGVVKFRSRWISQIKINGRNNYLGSFASEIDAALAYDRAAIEAWGEFARPNFPDGPPAGHVPA